MSDNKQPKNPPIPQGNRIKPSLPSAPTPPHTWQPVSPVHPGHPPAPRPNPGLPKKG
jgi:hypothetical protein